VSETIPLEMPGLIRRQETVMARRDDNDSIKAVARENAQRHLDSLATHPSMLPPNDPARLLFELMHAYSIGGR
jgi:hypothetical protein